MTQKGTPKAAGPAQQQHSKKRKHAPASSGKQGHDSKRPRFDQGSKMRDARTIVAQTTSKAFKNGELDVDKFVKSREYEIRALEQGLVRSKKALTKRAFQQVPKELRRRTASHNVKRVPKKLRERGKREMAEDNTPTITSRRRKPTRHMRLRLETAKKLRALGAKRKAATDKTKDEQVVVHDIPESGKEGSGEVKNVTHQGTIKTRTPKVKRATLSQAPIPKAKFRKRQIHKSWLPTHLYHAKRARITPPSHPLWRFAIPLTPTAKSYRPTHRAASERGAVCWDMSYVSTISLAGREASIIGVLKGLGIGVGEDGAAFWGSKGAKWRDGLRAMGSIACNRESPNDPIAPVTVIWCAEGDAAASDQEQERRRQVFVRTHPSAFFQIWEEILRLASIAKPAVSVEDLRFEIGSIELTGPGSIEALLSALWPSAMSNLPSTLGDGSESEPGKTDTPEDTFVRLAGLTNPSLLPQGALLGFDVQDPRLHHPPRKSQPPQDDASQLRLLELASAWPPDKSQKLASIFDRKERLAASTALPSQKSINRRRTLASPGQYPEPSPKDPRIPLLLYTAPSTASNGKQQSVWTVLLPWKCVQPVWYSLMYTPLSTSQQPRLGGLDELRQLALERGEPWFPQDFPGTNAGWDWELQERRQRKEAWKRRPKSKRTSWEALGLGPGRKGEVGLGWACDWDRLLIGGIEKRSENADNAHSTLDGVAPDSAAAPEVKNAHTPDEKKPSGLIHIPSATAKSLLLPSSTASIPAFISSGLATVRLTFITRGVPEPCARIYRLPTDPTERRHWLTLHPANQPNGKANGPKHSLPNLPKDAPAHIVQRRLAQSLLEPPKAGGDDYPACPAEEDLVGFVTTGNYDLGAGQGMGIGSILLAKVLEEAKTVMAKGTTDDGRLCVVRNAGLGIGRLARWDIV